MRRSSLGSPSEPTRIMNMQRRSEVDRFKLTLHLACLKPSKSNFESSYELTYGHDLSSSCHSRAVSNRSRNMIY